jgi:hypothetical protein
MAAGVEMPKRQTRDGKNPVLEIYSSARLRRHETAKWGRKWGSGFVVMESSAISDA